MIAVMDFQEELKTQRLQKTGPSIATAIRKEVEKEESQIKVCTNTKNQYLGINQSFFFIVLDITSIYLEIISIGIGVIKKRLDFIPKAK